MKTMAKLVQLYKHSFLMYVLVQLLMQFASGRDNILGMQTNEILQARNKSLTKEKNQSNKF